MDTITIVGTIGAIASVASFTPQAWKTIKTRSTDDLSAGMYGLTCLSFAMWLTFGILKGEWTMIIPNAACLALAAFIFVLILLPAHKTEKVAETLDPTTDGA
ncbi:SemiSWEET family sugar transporter [Sandarakinorhabdus glacialis]|nr:SemiSWEET family transporter [Polymorphobacter glacialis]